MNRSIVLCLALLTPAICLAGEVKPNELTGVFHKAVLKNPAYLEIDGVGFISRIIVTGDKIKDIPDATRIWVEGAITTDLYGSPERSKQDLQAAPTQWFIVFHVEKYVTVHKPFQIPEGEELQHKQVEATR